MKLTVMEYIANVAPRIHVAITGSAIKKTRVEATSWNKSAQVATSSDISLAKLLPEIKDEDFVKHIPYSLRGKKLSIYDDISSTEYTPEMAEQEAARYSIGYHAGDLGKSTVDDYAHQGYSRGSGHFGLYYTAFASLFLER